jgi:hypothetical protein
MSEGIGRDAGEREAVGSELDLALLKPGARSLEGTGKESDDFAHLVTIRNFQRGRWAIGKASNWRKLLIG